MKAEGYETPTPIQAAAIPALLAGRDLLGCAQTGTGKTAAFALPIIQRLSGSASRPAPRGCRVLVVAPTRELAAQIDVSFAAYATGSKITRACIFGGVGKSPQVKALGRGVDVLTATPGRLLDLVSEGQLRLDGVETVVLDEADRMLDMGFIRDVRKIIALLPSKRQTLLFSATMPSDIASLASSVLRDPIRVSVTPDRPTVDLIDQSVVFVEKSDKSAFLSALIRAQEATRAIVFTRTKHGADRLVKALSASGITSAAIHANKSQNNRTRTLEGFRSGDIRVLVATDLAARGIDVDGISHVYNYELPEVPETYVHRIGRTARAGAQGEAVALCDAEEKPLLRAIEKLIRMPVPLAQGAAFDAARIRAAADRKSAPPPLVDRGERRPAPRRNVAERSRNASSSHRDAGRGPQRDTSRGPSRGVRRDSTPAQQPRGERSAELPRSAAGSREKHGRGSIRAY
ncbi:MAG TPA: DEAD/DEAH box helicase [Rectinemataceae bacterium]|nr:DEAD/DEAH box helicase [Rectinemataceae bacterium]